MPIITLHDAITALRAGSIVAVPTETVYGLAVDALNPQAIKQLFALKHRPGDKTLPVAITGLEEISDWASEISPLALHLATHFWPGPLTLILPVRQDIPHSLAQGKASIALRCPAEPQLLAIIQGLGHGICLTSANPSGEQEAISTEQVAHYFGASMPIVASKAILSTLPSTIVDLTVSPYKILRQGPITAAQLTPFFNKL
jgi:L-threonylcarbamoyladenylate synthase